MTKVEGKVTKKNPLPPPKYKHWISFLKKQAKQNKTKQRGFRLCAVPSGAFWWVLWLNDGDPHPRRPNENPRHQERSQRCAPSLAPPGAGWHACASLRTHALSCVIPHLVTICHCHPWHVTPRQTDLTPVPSLTLRWEAVVTGIERVGWEQLILF